MHAFRPDWRLLALNTAAAGATSVVVTVVAACCLSDCTSPFRPGGKTLGAAGGRERLQRFQRCQRRLDLLYVSYRFACAREDLQTFICALNLACTLILVGSSEASPVLHARSRETVPYRNWYLKRVKGLSKNLYVDV